MSFKSRIYAALDAHPERYLGGNYQALATELGCAYHTVVDAAYQYRRERGIPALTPAERTEAARARDYEQYRTDKIATDKKVAEFHWRDAIGPMQAMQDLKTRASGGQDHARWSIDTDEEVCILFLGDTQLGSFGTDYDAFVRLTEEILTIPNLYVILLGDLLQMAIKLRGVYEAHDNAIDPGLQMKFLDSWLMDIRHKVICSTWDNHAVMRQENQAGYSEYAEIFRRHTIYHNHIGHLDIQVGKVTYKAAVSHFFRGKSILNAGHAPMRYMRHEAPDRDFAAQGDYHVPFAGKYFEGGKVRAAIVCGTLQVNSGYGKRFFSLYTQDNMPCITLNPRFKQFRTYWSISEWLEERSWKQIKEE